MKKALIWFASLILIFISGANPVKANEHAERVVKMRVVLTKYNSPMIGLEDTMIRTAEKYGLDWTLLAAIAGTESSFAKRMPYQCNNPYGWGIYGSNKLCFASLKDSIEGVASGLAKKYNISSIESIARTYNTVSTDGWIKHTKYFMNKIKTAEIPVSALPITL